MKTLAFVLLVLLVGSSLYLVKTSYEARRLFAQIDRARSTQEQLDAEFKRLDAERRVQATHLRIERTARLKLHMRTATPAVTHYVVDSADGAAAGGPAASEGAR